MNVEDYYLEGKRSFFRLHEKGGKLHTVPAHHSAEEYMDEYIAAWKIDSTKMKGSLWLTKNGNRLDRREVWAMVKRRAVKAGLPLIYAIIVLELPVSQLSWRITAR